MNRLRDKIYIHVNLPSTQLGTLQGEGTDNDREVTGKWEKAGNLNSHLFAISEVDRSADMAMKDLSVRREESSGSPKIKMSFSNRPPVSGLPTNGPHLGNLLGIALVKSSIAVGKFFSRE